MQEIKCPNCGKIFQVDEAGYAAIVRQVRDREFEKEIAQREQAYNNEKDSAVKVAVNETRFQSQKALADKDRQLAEKDLEIAKMCIRDRYRTLHKRTRTNGSWDES